MIKLKGGVIQVYRYTKIKHYKYNCHASQAYGQNRKEQKHSFTQIKIKGIKASDWERVFHILQISSISLTPNAPHETTPNHNIAASTKPAFATC